MEKNKMENYKWCFKKKHFLPVGKHKYRRHAWEDAKILWSEPSFLQ